MNKHIKTKFVRALPPASAISMLVFTTGSLLAAPAGPASQIPEGGGVPGAFPNTSVSGVNVIAKGSSAGFNGNVEVTGFDGQGPIAWTVNRYNRGDFALRLAPGNPAAALGNLNQGFIDFADNSPGLAASQAWRPHRNFGVIIPTARQNGPIDWNDGEGPFFPTVAISWASSGPSYSMVNGSFGTGDLDVNTGRAGTHASSPRPTSRFRRRGFPLTRGGSVATSARRWRTDSAAFHLNGARPTPTRPGFPPDWSNGLIPRAR